MFTTGNLCCGFFSLIEAAREHCEMAAILSSSPESWTVWTGGSPG
jgi:phosphatidylserine synthase